MSATLQQLEQWLRAKEDEHLEFREAKQNFHFEKLVKYCAALANEGGGSIILGVSDNRPRKVVGSQAFTDLERAKAGLIEKLRLRIEAGELQHPKGRVLVFTAPPRPIGMPIPVDGAYYMRAGEDLAPMPPDMLRRIFDESGLDFSAEIWPKATLADLDSEAIKEFGRCKITDVPASLLRTLHCSKPRTSNNFCFATVVGDFGSIRPLGPCAALATGRALR